MKFSIGFIVLGNFFSSLAAGVVLARGLSLMKEIPGFFGDSIITFLVGGFIAFGIVARLRKTQVAAVWPLSFAALLASTLLLYLSKTGVSSSFEHVSLFLLMSIFFATTLASRSLRSDLAASEHSKLPIAEVAYSAGYLVGLGLMALDVVVSMADAFMAATVALVATTVIDKLGEGKRQFTDMAAKFSESTSPAPLSSGDWKLALQFGLITIGVQILLQRYSSWAGTTLPLASFEVGVLAATIAATLAHPTLVTKTQTTGLIGAKVSLQGRATVFRVGPVFILTLLTPVAGIALSELGVHATVAAAMFLAASFCYEYLSLALLQQIGRNRGNVALVFAATAVVATVAYGASMLVLN